MFRKNHSTAHMSIHLTKRIREQSDHDNYGCGTFSNFQKAFHTVDQNVLLKKLEQHGIRVIS